MERLREMNSTSIRSLVRKIRRRGIRGATTRAGAREHIVGMITGQEPTSKGRRRSDTYLRFHDRKYGIGEAWSLATLQTLPLSTLRSLHKGALEAPTGSQTAKKLRDIMRYKRGINESSKRAKSLYKTAIGKHFGSMQDKLKRAEELAKWKPIENPFTKPFDADKKKEVKESHNIETLERFPLGKLRKLHKKYSTKGTKEARKEAATILRIMRSRQLSEGSVFSFSDMLRLSEASPADSLKKVKMKRKAVERMGVKLPSAHPFRVDASNEARRHRQQFGTGGGKKLSEAKASAGSRKLSKASVEELHFRHDGISDPKERAEFDSFLSDPRIHRVRKHPNIHWHLKDLHALHRRESEPLNRRAAKALAKDLGEIG